MLYFGLSGVFKIKKSSLNIQKSIRARDEGKKKTEEDVFSLFHYALQEKSRINLKI